MKNTFFIAISVMCMLGVSSAAQEESEEIESRNPDFGNATFDPNPEITIEKTEPRDVRLRTIKCPEHRVERGTASRPNEIIVQCRIPAGAEVVQVVGYARDAKGSGFCKSSNNRRYRECEIGWAAYRGEFHYRPNNQVAWRFANWLDNSRPRYAWLTVTYTY